MSAPSGVKWALARAFLLQLAPTPRTLSSRSYSSSYSLRDSPKPKRAGEGAASTPPGVRLTPRPPGFLYPRTCRAGVGESGFRRGLEPEPCPLHFTPVKESCKIPEERLEAGDGWGGESVHSFLPLPPPLGLSLLGGLGRFSQPSLLTASLAGAGQTEQC